MIDWTKATGVRLDGKTAVITGATSGIGMEAALALGRMGAHVVVSGRRGQRGREVVGRIQADSPGGGASFEPLDLADLSNVATFAERVAAAHPKIDILINNAGVLAAPTRMLTADGFELQFGTNYLAHFALTARLLASLRQAGAARVVNISSISHHACRLSLDDLQAERRRYRPWTAYAESKLAMLTFALELQRRSARGGWGVLGLAAHPGLAATEIPSAGPGLGQARPPFSQRVMMWGLPFIGQSAAAGALPTVAAAAIPNVQGGSYVGPTGFLEWRGRIGAARISAAARDETTAAELWSRSEELAGVRFP